MSLIKIYLKFLKFTPTCFGHSTIIREFLCSSLKSLLSTTLWIFQYLKLAMWQHVCSTKYIVLYLVKIYAVVVKFYSDI